MDKKLSVCIIEDEPLMRDYLCNNLEKIHSDFHVTAFAANGNEAMDILSSNSFDLILSDIKMPGYSGLEVAESLRKNEDETPIILITGYDDFAYAKSAIRLDVSDYLLKPLNDNELRDALEKIKVQILKRRQSITLPENLTPENLAQLIAEKFAAESNNSEDFDIIKSAVDYITQHFCENMSQADVADAIGVSPSYLSGLFHEGTGESYSQFIKRLRMTKAAALLKSQPSMTINVIAESVGYFSDKHFMSVFKNYFGMTPNDYRKQ